jgi:hypothetical protein
MRTKALAMALVACVGLVAAGGLVPQAKAADEKKVESKSEKYTSAATINFGGQLGLPFESVANLGARIEAARRQSDPVSLAVLGLELAAAEKVAGKKADLTSDALLKEAVSTAKLRANSKELLMVAQLLKDDKAAKELTAEADKAAKRENDEAEAAKSGEAPRGAQYLRVHNDFHEGVQIYVDGQQVGWVRPGARETFYIHKHHRHFTLFARHHHRTWGPVEVEGQFETYHWRITE